MSAATAGNRNRSQGRISKESSSKTLQEMSKGDSKGMRVVGAGAVPS